MGQKHQASAAFSCRKAASAEEFQVESSPGDSGTGATVPDAGPNRGISPAAASASSNVAEESAEEHAVEKCF